MDERMDGRITRDPACGPGREWVELVGGPLDGLVLDVAGWPAAERAAGTLLMTEVDDPGGRAAYEARPGDAHRFDWRG
ncbi:hypothetical protein [Streptomyces sp. NPDC093225]|uniref:hypothetical protein n=1 Tax=Streptomyces sp. NPDC093225 TaxID=3366034 RepID=UPI0037F65AEF